MAQRVQVILVDDLDATTTADETVRFALDGVSYEIDVSARNAERLRGDLASWVGHARRAGGRKSTRTLGGAKRNDLSAIRDWARENGYQVSDRGRISGEVQAAYDKAHD